MVEALLADAEDLHLLAVGEQAVDVLAGQPDDGRVERAAQPALGGADDQQMNLVLAGADHQRRTAFAALERRGEIGEHRLHAGGVRPRRLGRHLRAPELRRGHHLHGLGDLLRRLDGRDAVAELFQRRHGLTHAKALANLSTAALSLSPVSLVISFLSRMASRMSGMLGAHVAQQLGLEAAHGGDLDRIEIAVNAGIDHHHLLLDLHRRELRLLEQLGQARAAIEQALGGGVEVGAELGEGGHLAILRELALDLAGDLLHRLHLRGRAHARHRQAHIHRGPDALIEQIGLEEDLAVGDGDDVGRDIGRHVVGLRLDHRQRGQRARAVVLVELGGALEQPRMEIEHVAGIGLAPRRAAEQQRHLAIGHGLLGQVVIERPPHACRCRGNTRPWRSPKTARDTASAPGPRRWRRPRWNRAARRCPPAP